MSFLVSDIVAELNQRSNFRLHVLTAGNAQTALLQAINMAGELYYEGNYFKNAHYEKSTLDGAPIVLPAGVLYGASAIGKIYELTTVTTGALPADFVRVKDLTVLGDSGVVTSSSSTYDDGVTEGSGIPLALISNANVYHKLTGKGANALLRIYAGATTVGASSTHISMVYQRAYIPVAANSDPVDVPDDLRIGTFLPSLNNYLSQYFGYS